MTDRFATSFLRLATAGAIVAGCAASPASTPAESASPSTAAASSTVAPSASTLVGGLTGDHPAGRIAFGRITRIDPLYNQVVALYAIDPDGSDLVQLTDGESAFPAWSPDGTRLAYTVGLPDGTWQIATMARDGSDVRVLTSGPGIHEVPTWSPDGTWLAYDYSPLMPDDPGFKTVLYRMDADGSNPQLLGDPDTFDVEPRISPDGSSVLFERLTIDNDVQQQVMVVRDLASGEERVITAAGTAPTHGFWSPDGKWIIYNIYAEITDEVPNDQVELIAADGSGEPIVLFKATSSTGGFKPWYSPDGSRILFGCFGLQGDDDAACLMDADGANVEILIDQPGVFENHFSWGVSAP